MPKAKPTRAGSSPPTTPNAATANTGNNKNKPNMRAANKPASAKLARRSIGVKDNDWGSGIKLLFQGGGQVGCGSLRAL
jgi:hypothetical protein